MIPIVDLKAQYASIKDEIGIAIQGVLDSCQFTLGSEVSALEKEFASYCGATDAIGLKAYTSGRSGTRFGVLLYRASTGELLALLESDYLGQVRTGAASGVATKYLAREDARRLGVYLFTWTSIPARSTWILRSLKPRLRQGRGL